MSESFNFDQIIDRRETNALACEGYRDYLFGADTALSVPRDGRELISMWVADMAFASAPAAAAAIRARLEHPVLGYTMNFDSGFYNAFAGWTQHHFDWSCEPDELLVCGGIVPALYDFAQLLCQSDEHLLTLTPAYGFFKHAADHHDRELKPVALVRDGATFTIDFDALTKAAAHPKARVLFLCHPHNPTGRIWSDSELSRVAQICIDHNVLIVSDEVHCDLRRHGQPHTPLARLIGDSDQIITCMSPGKTFNLAGLLLGAVIIRNRALRKLWQQRVQPLCNPLSLAAATGVYTNGHAWVDALRHYLDESFDLLQHRLHTELPQAVFSIPAATYMAWIDLGAYFPGDTNLTRFFLEQTGVILEGGEMFVAHGGRFVRLNLACPHAVLNDALDRMVAAISARADR